MINNLDSNGGEKSTTWDNFILPKFKKQQPSNSSSFLQQQQQMRFPPPPFIDLNNNAVPQPQPYHVTHEGLDETTAATNDHYYGGETTMIPRRERANSNASFSNSFLDEEDEEEDLVFDFKKEVVAMSKNVKTFSEGVMGNGLRMFNNLSTRIKNNSSNHHGGGVELDRGGVGYK